MDKETQDRILKTVVMPLLAGLGGWLVGSGKLTSDQWGAISNFLLTYGPGLLTAAAGVYGYFKSKPEAKVLDAKNVPGVVDIQVDTSKNSPAPPAVIALAKDDNVEKVNPVG